MNYKIQWLDYQFHAIKFSYKMNTPENDFVIITYTYFQTNIFYTKYPITKLTFLIFFLCVFFNCLYSQDRLAALDIVDQRAVNLQEEDIAFIENLQNSPTVENISFVQVPDVVSIQQDGRLSLRFSYNGLTHNLGVFALDVDYDSPEKYTWRGEIPEYNGVFAVIKNQIGYSGFLSIDNLHFEIYAINSSHSLLGNL